VSLRARRRSDNGGNPFCFNDVEMSGFVRTGVENAQIPKAFQADNGGSIPLTRPTPYASAFAGITFGNALKRASAPLH